VPEAEWQARGMETIDLGQNQVGMGRELFAIFRNGVSEAEQGATSFSLPPVIHASEKATV